MNHPYDGPEQASAFYAESLEYDHDAAADEADADDYDPTPWCSGCGSMSRSGCHCGPIAENE